VLKDEEYDSCYTFNSPFAQSNKMSQLEAFPQKFIIALK
jgi:hypothetical protein